LKSKNKWLFALWLFKVSANITKVSNFIVKILKILLSEFDLITNFAPKLHNT
jgi:hypothetical protein